MIGLNRAINIYFSRNPQSKRRLNKIAKWNENKTLKENYDALGINPGDAFQLARHYGLDYKKIKITKEK